VLQPSQFHDTAQTSRSFECTFQTLTIGQLVYGTIKLSRQRQDRSDAPNNLLAEILLLTYELTHFRTLIVLIFQFLINILDLEFDVSVSRSSSSGKNWEDASPVALLKMVFI
jgi:hypothetical protein